MEILNDEKGRYAFVRARVNTKKFVFSRSKFKRSLRLVKVYLDEHNMAINPEEQYLIDPFGISSKEPVIESKVAEEVIVDVNSNKSEDSTEPDFKYAKTLTEKSELEKYALQFGIDLDKRGKIETMLKEFKKKYSNK